MPLIAKVLSDGRGRVSGAHPVDGRFITRGHDDHCFGQPVRAKIALEKIVHLAAPFAHQRHDNDGGGGVPGEHPQQHAFAHAGAGEDTHPLTAAAG